MPDRSPIVRKAERYAVTRLYVELTRILQDSLCEGVCEIANGECSSLAVIACAVAVGHFEGRPMNATKIALYIDMPRTTALRKLTRLVEQGAIARRGNLYYIAPQRASGLKKLTIDQMVRKVTEAYRALPLV
jgi:hypothetical protein